MVKMFNERERFEVGNVPQIFSRYLLQIDRKLQSTFVLENTIDNKAEG